MTNDMPHYIFIGVTGYDQEDLRHSVAEAHGITVDELRQIAHTELLYPRVRNIEGTRADDYFVSPAAQYLDRYTDIESVIAVNKILRTDRVSIKDLLTPKAEPPKPKKAKAKPKDETEAPVPATETETE